MKKNILSVLLTVVFASCSDFLEEENKGLLLSETFFSNAQELQLGVNGIYHLLIDAHFNDQVTAATLGSNDITSRFVGFQEFDVFAPTGGNAQTSRYWAEIYSTIAAANELILNYEGANATEEEKRIAAGQAYFARAYSYFTLVRIWNEIPIYTENEVSYDIGLSGPAEVYDLIIEDLQRAEEMLPAQWTGVQENIAFTSGAAKSLLAYVYLTMAGYPLNDPSNYARAASKAKEVIDNEGEYGYRLLDNFTELWRHEARFNDEIVIGLFYNLDFRNNQRAPFGQMPTEYGGWDVYFAEINFFNNFPAGARKEATFATEFYLESGDTLQWTETLQRRPYYTKYWDIPGLNWEEPWEYVDWKSERTNVVMRYANVLLTYAEAKAMSDGPDASAYDAVNRVRNRAGLEDLAPGLTTTAFRDSVVQERSWEHAGGEFAVSPWYDLVRLERVEAAAADRHSWEQPILNPPTKEDYFAPYPDKDVLLNPNLGG
ncbi:MAG: RagB/SusD family nutrient uptake outer membrane protein [Cytophagales bacterium]|nr:RagB/SusD family nutrient uptake outer membrane protein [Cytophagales bacterium]